MAVMSASRATASTASTRSSPTTSAPPRTRRTSQRPALGATLRTNRRELALAELYRVPTEEDRRSTTLAPGELILELDVPAAERSVYLKAMDRKRWAFPIVGVAAARSAGVTRVALAGVAPVPWLLEGSLDDATPLPRNAYKVDVARALVKRALAALEQG